MRKYLLLIFAMMIIALAITGVFIIRGKNKTVAGVVIATSPSSEYPRIEKFEVPILMYHYIRNARNETELGQKLSVSPTNLDRQMGYLKEHDYETMKLADLADPDKKELSRIYFEKKKPIILTFDDGYRDAYTEALPILKKYGFIGTFFIIRDLVGRNNRMSQKQIDELQNEGFEIGAHTLRHPDLSKISINEQRKQIFDSKEGADTFCYPSGKYNDETISLVKEAGYMAAVTTKIGVVNETSNLYELPRVRIENFGAQGLADRIQSALEHS